MVSVATYLTIYIQLYINNIFLGKYLDGYELGKNVFTAKERLNNIKNQAFLPSFPFFFFLKETLEFLTIIKMKRLEIESLRKRKKEKGQGKETRLKIKEKNT